MAQPPAPPGTTPGDLTQRYRGLGAIYWMTRTLAAARTETEIGQKAIRALIEIAPGRRASLQLSDGAGVPRFHARHGLSHAYRAALEGYSPWHPQAGPHDRS